MASLTIWRVELEKASLNLTGKCPNTNRRRIGFLDECNWKISYTSLYREEQLVLLPWCLEGAISKCYLNLLGWKTQKTNSLGQTFSGVQLKLVTPLYAANSSWYIVVIWLTTIFVCLVWVSFNLNAPSFVYKCNPSEQASAPGGRY